MKKLEPGILCRLVNCDIPENNGTIVTILEKHKTIPYEFNRLGVNLPKGPYWRVDKDIRRTCGRVMPFCREAHLQPINPDHQPADEEWKADFKRMLSGGQKAKEKPVTGVANDRRIA